MRSSCNVRPWLWCGGSLFLNLVALAGSLVSPFAPTRQQTTLCHHTRSRLFGASS
jgi:hypothetical protein